MQKVMDTLETAISLIREDWGTRAITEIDGYEISWHEDEDGLEYALLSIDFNLPSQVYAEIDYDTYGKLYGFRIYNN